MLNRGFEKRLRESLERELKREIMKAIWNCSGTVYCLIILAVVVLLGLDF